MNEKYLFYSVCGEQGIVVSRLYENNCTRTPSKGQQVETSIIIDSSAYAQISLLLSLNVQTNFIRGDLRDCFASRQMRCIGIWCEAKVSFRANSQCILLAKAYIRNSNLVQSLSYVYLSTIFHRVLQTQPKVLVQVLFHIQHVLFPSFHSFR